jgi:perosamine synthetase
MKRLRNIADKYGLKLIEDACEALGSEYSGVKTGSMADGAVFAFYPNKQITTGEGGMVVTNNDDIAALCRSLRNQGRSKGGLWLEHEYLGYNYRMNEISAAIGSVQMDRLDEIIRKRCIVADMYNKALSGIKGVKLPYISPNVTIMSWFVYVIMLEDGKKQASMMQSLVDAGVACRPYFSPIHLQKYMAAGFGYCEGDFPVAEKAGKSCIAVPFYNNITMDEIAYVAEKVKEGLK